MKFTTILFSAALIAGAAATTTTVATTSTSTTTSSAPVNTDSSYGPVVDKCIKSCSASDVGCLATCLGNPSPTPEQVNQTTKCAAACHQGNGTAAETEAYARCQWDCTVKYFLPNPSNVPNSGTTQTSGTYAPKSTDSHGNVVNSTSTSTSTSTSKPTGNSGSSTMVYSTSFAAVVAAFAAAFAL